MEFKNKMFCPDDGLSESYIDGNDWGSIKYPKKEDMINITKEFPLISSNSKYEVMKGDRTGCHSDLEDGGQYYYQVNDKDDYYAIYYDGKKVDDIVTKSVDGYRNNMYFTDDINELKSALDKFDVSTLVVDDYLRNNRNETLTYSAYLGDGYKALEKISDCRHDEDSIEYLHDLHFDVSNKINKQKDHYYDHQDAYAVAQLASVTCFVPNKSTIFYKTISSIDYCRAIKNMNPDKTKGLKNIKDNISYAYSYVKAISFGLVEKKILHKDKKMTKERVTELCKDALKLNQTYKKPIDSNRLLLAIKKLPEVENFIALDHTYDDVKNIFKAAKKSIEKERSKSKSYGR